MFTTRLQAWVRRTAQSLAARLSLLPITPNQVTVAGLAVTTLAAALIALDHPFLGGLALLFAGAFDIFDGALARASARSYAYGAFLDSTIDRYAEFVVMLALLVYFQRHGVVIGPALVVIALAGSLLVSYVRARAQSLGFSCDGGLLARPERVIITVAGLLLTPFSNIGLLVVVWLLAVLTNFTAVQRVWLVWRQSRQRLQESEAAVGDAARASADRAAIEMDGAAGATAAAPPAEPKPARRGPVGASRPG
jgi:CDP-diacylglycerol--glycerol-3-phosphate 3-phosphatidyltransferase